MRRRTTVGEVMGRPAVVAQEGMWFREALRLMRANRIGCLPVVDGLGRLSGVLTEEDLLLKAARGWIEARPIEHEPPGRRRDREKARAISVRDLMTSPTITVPAHYPVGDAARLMRRQGIRHLVVTDQRGCPVGVVSRGDLLGIYLRADAEIEDEVEDVVARTLRGAAQPDVHVSDGLVLIEAEELGGPQLEDLTEAVEQVEGVVAARVWTRLAKGEEG